MKKRCGAMKFPFLSLEEAQDPISSRQHPDSDIDTKSIKR